MDVNKLVEALASAFACGFAIQRLAEVLDGPISRVAQGDLDKKKTYMAWATVVVGLATAAWLDLGIVAAVSGKTLTGWNVFADRIVSGLIISAGTEGFNTILKFLGYAKEAKKADSASKKESAPALGNVNRGPNLAKAAKT